eukprot:CAMPEP_0204392394 /NCGR_PEP_ID=MMETSP0469-20131031/61735_1 /ASSEMBLY_ACC=CAM_ASM_000384 /TAXON_ID=2969 /ORGANISM="Oxyrrhis marina" /LENGTH=201 /DNA_ID=CAMNT_0051386371 /DNA_START=37 /DNA_END=642 /DNA_ORIENTATION=-
MADEQQSTVAAVEQLFARLKQEIDEHQPANVIHFIVDFLCRYYPEHLHGFASIWNADPELERERLEVVNFFKYYKISTQVAAHFTNAGYDTLETLATLNTEALVDIENFNNIKWLPGHKVRLQQIFSDVNTKVRIFQQNSAPVNMGYINVPPSRQGAYVMPRAIGSIPAGAANYGGYQQPSIAAPGSPSNYPGYPGFNRGR